MNKIVKIFKLCSRIFYDFYVILIVYFPILQVFNAYIRL